MLFFVSVLFAATYILSFTESVSASEQNTETEDNMVYNFSKFTTGARCCPFGYEYETVLVQADLLKVLTVKCDEFKAG